MKTPHDESAAGCAGCTRGSRREFLGHVSGAVAAAVMCEGWVAALGATGIVEVSAAQTGPTTLTYPVPAGDGVSIDKKEQMILVRFQQKVYVFPLACPHENTALRWRQGDMRFQCPRHDSKYQARRHLHGRSRDPQHGPLWGQPQRRLCRGGPDEAVSVRHPGGAVGRGVSAGVDRPEPRAQALSLI